jgi:hypothetical protein
MDNAHPNNGMAAHAVDLWLAWLASGRSRAWPTRIAGSRT